jgi:coproporphyrinogen III oxidase-like Fe-S oxidoreductase
VWSLAASADLDPSMILEEGSSKSTTELGRNWLAANFVGLQGGAVEVSSVHSQQLTVLLLSIIKLRQGFSLLPYRGNIVSLYIHIPFASKSCTFYFP